MKASRCRLYDDGLSHQLEESREAWSITGPSNDSRTQLAPSCYIFSCAYVRNPHTLLIAQARDVEARLDHKSLNWLNSLPPGETRKKVEGMLDRLNERVDAGGLHSREHLAKARTRDSRLPIPSGCPES